MLAKIKHSFIALILLSLVLGAAGCSTILPRLVTPPQPSNSTEPTNPGWTFPSDDGQPTTFLPDFSHVVARVKPAVVSVTTEKIYYDIFNREYSEKGAGSGVIIDAQGYIVTNNHVIEGATSIEVKLDDGSISPATIAGSDAIADIAVIKIEGSDLPYAQLGDSSQLREGDWVLAIGNAFGLGLRVTEGIVSGQDITVTLSSGAELSNLIETTAAINPGNSGGPLANMAGEVVGITSAKIIGAENMGYALSINGAKPVIEDIITQGFVIRPWLGVRLYTVDAFVAAANDLSVDQGALIHDVVPDSPAEAAGLKMGDVVVEFQGRDIVNVDDLVQAIHECQIGEEVKITFVRGEETKITFATLRQTPED
jgi:serine protease Do